MSATVYNLQTRWRLADGSDDIFPATVVLDDDPDVTSVEMLLQAMLTGVLEHNLSDFPDELESAELVAVIVESTQAWDS